MADNTEYSKEELQEIIKGAVAEKGDVLTTFRGVKKDNKYGFKYLCWKFLGGLAFGLGLMIMLLITAWLLSNFNEVRAVLLTHGKLVSMLKALGR